MQTRGSNISDEVDRKLEALRLLPVGPESGRPLNLCEPGVNPAEAGSSSDNFLRLIFKDIGQVVGADFVTDLDPALLEQFSIMSIERNEHAGEILKTLITSFMSAYAREATSDEAIESLKVLLALSTPAASTATRAD